MTENRNDAIAIGIVLFAVFLMPFSDAVAKLLGVRYPVAEVAWMRYAAHMVILLPISAWRYGPRALIPRPLGLHLLRSTLMVGATLLFFLGLTRLPMADTLALLFLYPMLVTALSAALLGERVGWRRWAAVCGGLLGTLIIIRPGSDVFQWWSLIPIGAGTCFSLYLVTTRRLGTGTPPLISAFFSVTVGAAVLPVALPVGWTTPTVQDAALGIAMGALAAGAHFLLAAAFQKAPASLLAPFGYAEMIMAASLGYLIFGDFPDGWSWVGIAVITASGIYLSIRERKVAQA